MEYLESDVTLAGARDSAAKDGCVVDEETNLVCEWTSLSCGAVGPVTPSHVSSLQNTENSAVNYKTNS